MGFMALAAVLGGSTPPPSVSVPTSVSKEGNTASQTTSSVTATVTGGLAPFTYSWTRTSGDTEVSATAPSAATTAFTDTTLVAGEIDTATFTCTVTDALGRTASDSINVTIERYAALTASASPTTLSAEGNTATVTTASSTCTAGGGSGSYSYSWAKISGGTVTAVSASSATSTFRGSTMTAGETRTAVFRCTVTDTVTGATATTADVNITVRRYATLSASASPTSVSGSGTTTSITSNSSTATPSGGSGSFTYAWEKVDGGAITAVSASSATSTFRGSSMAEGETRTANFRCKVTDSVTGTIVYTGNVAITVSRDAATTYTPAGGTSASPVALSDYQLDGPASVTITASASAVWNWTETVGTLGTCNVANGGSATSITFTLNNGATAGQILDSGFSCNSGGKYWTITLQTENSAGSVMTL